MEILKIAMLFVSLACLTFGKFIEPKTQDASERFEETLEIAGTLQDATLSQSEGRVNDYFSRYLAAPAADIPLRDMCQYETSKTRTSDLFDDQDKEFFPAFVSQTYCVSESDDQRGQCRPDYCRTKTMRMQFYWRPKNSNGKCNDRLRRKYKTINVGCRCMAPH